MLVLGHSFRKQKSTLTIRTKHTIDGQLVATNKQKIKNGSLNEARTLYLCMIIVLLPMLRQM